jgi:hypothetical protein
MRETQHVGPDLQAVRVATDVARFLEACGRLFAARSWFEHSTAALERIRATA